MKIIAHPIGKKLHRLEIWHDGVLLGEYERSQEADIPRKTEEVRAAFVQLAEIARTHGPFVVRWHGQRRSKVVSVGGREVAVVPRDCWRRPSWQ